MALVSASPALADSNVARDAECLLVVDGVEVIHGRCKFGPWDNDGPFTIPA